MHHYVCRSSRLTLLLLLRTKYFIEWFSDICHCYIFFRWHLLWNERRRARENIISEWTKSWVCLFRLIREGFVVPLVGSDFPVVAQNLIYFNYFTFQHFFSFLSFQRAEFFAGFLFHGSRAVCRCVENQPHKNPWGISFLLPANDTIFCFALSFSLHRLSLSFLSPSTFLFWWFFLSYLLFFFPH